MHLLRGQLDQHLKPYKTTITICWGIAYHGIVHFVAENWFCAERARLSEQISGAVFTVSKLYVSKCGVSVVLQALPRGWLWQGCSLTLAEVTMHHSGRELYSSPGPHAHFRQ